MGEPVADDRDWPQVKRLAETIVGAVDMLAVNEGLAENIVARATHIASLELCRRLVGPIALAEWLRNSADAVERHVATGKAEPNDWGRRHGI